MTDQPDSFTFDQWGVVEPHVELDRIAANETIFSLGNGLLGLRGTFDENRCVYHVGTYVNGFYETEPIIYGEIAYGFAKKKQRMLNVTDGSVIELYLDDEPFDLSTGTIRAYERRLDLRHGNMVRSVHWESPSGKRIVLTMKRLVSFTRQHVAALDWQLHTVDKDAVVTIVSGLAAHGKPEVGHEDPRVGAALTKNALILRNKRLGEYQGSLRHITRNTHFSIVAKMAHQLQTECQHKAIEQKAMQEISHRFHIWAEAGKEIRLTKYLSYFTSHRDESRKMFYQARREVHKAWVTGFDGLLSEQDEFLSEFWSHSDVRIEGDPAVQQSIRFNLFHLLQAAGRNGRTGIGAKGLTGEGYEGHYFWDTEIYALPFFTYTMPEIARKLLEFRYNTLGQARERARELHLKGALYPWRTINGEEASAYFPAGTAQFHINADIMYGVRKYLDATGDTDFLLNCAAEMAFETARLWVDLGDYIEGKGFCLNEVTGPNEYTAMVNNNVYTNVMARDNLSFATQTAETMQRDYQEQFDDLSDRMGLHTEEITRWKRAAAEMYIPFDKKRGLYPQDDSFFDKAVWDFENTPEERYPLLLYYHPLTIYRHQVLKQPDLVMGMFLQGAHFTREEKRKNFDYYDPLTTGDSSLSPCIQCIVAAEVGYTELAYEYFMKTCRIDLDDINRNVKDGVHTAAMAGTWLSLVYGFAGMRDYNGVLSFQPFLPASWSRLAFRIRMKGQQIEVDLESNKVTYRLLSGEELRFFHIDREVYLHPDEPAVFLLRDENERAV